jgi:hypothetical protein
MALKKLARGLYNGNRALNSGNPDFCIPPQFATFSFSYVVNLTNQSTTNQPANQPNGSNFDYDKVKAHGNVRPR